jgi:nucleoside-diphosphate-sugar epimerase
MQAKPNIIILGCGWLGQQLGQAFASAGYSVYGSRQSEAGLANLPAAIQPLLLQLPVAELPEQQQVIWQGAWLLCAIPPATNKRSQTEYLELLRNVADLGNKAGVRGVIHCSSTGVYQGLTGDVTEKSVLPQSGKSLLLAEAEQQLQLIKPCVTLRLAGLIGPGRHPANFTAGRLIAGSSLPVNMVHAQDIAEFILGLLSLSLVENDCFNLCCPEHPTKEQFYNAAAVAVGMPPPKFIETEEQARQVSALYSQTLPGFNYRFTSPLSALPYC